jgi:hypothetical protein
MNNAKPVVMSSSTLCWVRHVPMWQAIALVI